jgi:quercetin dioxygenase-like cupin family protein
MRKDLRRLAVAGAAVVGLAAGTTGTVGGGTAVATEPGPGVTATVISQTTFGDTDYILRQITVPPGQSTGWHFHDGTLYGLVEQGTLSHFDAACRSDGVYPAGSSVVEPSGSDHVHIGRNLGDTPVVLDVLYVLPHGAPYSEDAPNPGCDFE